MNVATQTEFTGDCSEPHDAKPASTPEPPALEDIAQHFPGLEILGLLGRGGMGAVYKARQKQLDRLVALKILPPRSGDDSAFAERFTREARALAKLLHPNIVALFEFGQADGICYLLMEFVDGVSLGQLLRSGRISPREALAIVPQICDALQYAHDQGIVHRDIKPENILLDRRGHVKVADFGLAKMVAGQAGSPLSAVTDDNAHQTVRPASELTQAGKIMGTPKYMSPEQVEHPQDVDHRADIFSLGVVFYEMLTGELPSGTFQPPSCKVQVDVRLDEVVLRALEKEPERRYQQVSQVKADVQNITRPVSPPADLPAAQPSQTLPLNRGGDGSSPANRTGLRDVGTSRPHPNSGAQSAPERRGVLSPDRRRSLMRDFALIAAGALALLLAFGTWLVARNLWVTKGITPPPGLVSWWPGEGSGRDVVGNNDGTLFNVTYTNGEVGQAFVFNGTDSYVLVPSSANLNPTGSFSIEAWVYPQQNPPEGAVLVTKWGDTGEFENQRSFTLSLLPGRALNFGISDSDHQWDGAFQAFPTDPGAVTAQAWNHVAAVYDQSSGTRRIFVNGEQVKSRTDTPITICSGEAPLTLGAHSRGGGQIIGHFSGLLDEVSLYHRALSAEEIQAIYNAGSQGKREPRQSLSATARAAGLRPEPDRSRTAAWPAGLVSAWPAEGYGLDATGRNNGVLKNGVGFAAGVVGQAFVFDGNSQSYVQVPDSPTLRLTNALTISCWAKRLKTSQVHNLLEKGGDWTGGHTDY
ncbi:MAG: protein kinase, partial [Verrucomicrobia bacterium]|nr:protein kinase [Verrucomicrobiota bacterium]